MIYKIKHPDNRVDEGKNVLQKYNGYERWVSELQSGYVAWKNEGNIPEELPYVAPTVISDSQKWEAIRMKRRSILRDTDWTQVADSPLIDNAEIKTYRQALRDIPQTYSDPDKVVFPTHDLKI